MTSFDSLVNEVRSILRGFGLVREGIAYLTADITSGALTFDVDDASALAPGLVEIGSEILYIRSISGNSITIAPDGRGWDGTTAAAHLADARVTANPPYPTWRIERALNDTIVSAYPEIWAVGTTSFTYNPSQSTYSVPAEAEEILKVTTTVLGPSQDQFEINHYTFNSGAPAASFATGNCITLGEAPEPGRTVTVAYATQPSEIASGDLFTASGLRDTARPAIVYGTVARLLSFVDATRTLTDSAVSSEYGSTQKVGTATQLAAQMTARYQLEVSQERERLRKTHPTRVRWRR